MWNRPHRFRDASKLSIMSGVDTKVSVLFLHILEFCTSCRWQMKWLLEAWIYDELISPHIVSGLERMPCNICGKYNLSVTGFTCIDSE